ncbi:dehydrogenase/reductase SDR family member 4 isoform X3 [Theropithecus gelada]|uniref:dehydrogenase/reductase SDR family member 4 isoform X3 n=1 Tax=Theropithecus gelada TaxID=9565 RepID=UPI000DC16E96|nr:dehydrogenase/reductase SDR family member 4 isoform X3 [Theropithecus gelada]
MHKAGLLDLCVRAWNSVRMASSGMTRRDPLANKVALVTASTDGIGFAIARRLAQDGAHVVVSSRKQQNVDQAVATLQGEGLSVTGTVCHVGKAEDRERLVATAVKLHGSIDILVSTAAASTSFGSLMDITEEIRDKGFLPYNVSKTALLGLTKTLAIALAPRNIRVNCLAPGLITTRLCSVLWIDKEKEERMKETLQIRRLGEPEDYAGILSFLCSEDASYITGETVVVGGGTPSRL